MRTRSMIARILFLWAFTAIFCVPKAFSQIGIGDVHDPNNPGGSIIATGYAYAYDAVGNRISRVLTFKKTMKSDNSIGETGEEEQPPMSDFIGEREILIYPNPTRGQMKIEFKGDYDIERTAVTIYTMNGVLVFTSNMNQNPMPIDISEQANGVYILRIADGDSFTSWRLVKE
ncbi:MAG: T9SS type A sorting domain-containing protein [Salinivirgaceae bacterium]|nr:T9SS type A sorting domain-containing protein [Salinivirgaceae bacterium]MDD4747076.1 T9SS type A sorting domain-containing protein [Salinivirgaceae bacterium]